MPADAGALTYTKGAESKTGSVAIDSWDVDSTGKVTYTCLLYTSVCHTVLVLRLRNYGYGPDDD